VLPLQRIVVALKVLKGLGGLFISGWISSHDHRTKCYASFTSALFFYGARGKERNQSYLVSKNLFLEQN